MEDSIWNTNRYLKLFTFVLLLAFAGLNAGCSDKGANDDQSQTEQSEESDKKKDGEEKEEKPPVPVEVSKVVRGDIQQTYRTITTLEAEEDAEVVARSTGLLESILVEEGDSVKQGQLLAQLDVEQLSLEVDQLEATANKLRKELNRQQKLFNRKLGSSDALDRAKYEYESQQAQLKLSKLRLKYASIEAPINGIVTERMVKKGNLIRENEVLFKIVDLQSLKAILHLPERELANVKKDQPILLQVDALEKGVIAGQIERIRPSIDTDTGTFKVVAKLDNSSNQLKPGMFGKVEVVFDEHQNSILLQQQALITQDNRSHVFVVKDNKAIQTAVTLGFRNNGLVEITEGLNESDRVITTGQQILKHDALVEIVNEEKDIAMKDGGASSAPSNVAANP